MGSSTNPMLARYVIPDMPSADELLPYLRQIDSHRWYSNFGPLVGEFERRLLAFWGDDTIAVTTLMTCYHALQIGLQLFRLPPSANVLVPAVTFPACPLAIQHAGATPVFADIDAASWQLTPETARAVCAAMPIHAVMPVAVYGVPVDVKAWDAFMSDTGIPVIIDAAAAFDAQLVPEKCLLAHSLHATKPFSIGEGGALVSRRRDWIDTARVMSNFGTVNRITERNGGNAKLSEYHAAVGLAQLDRWQQVKQRRREAFLRYQTALDKAGYNGGFQSGLDQAVVSALMLRSIKRPAQDIIQALHAQGIAAHQMYLPPLYRHPHFAGMTVVNEEGKSLKGFASLEHKAALMPNSEKMNLSVFGLPCHAFLTESDIAEAAEALRKALNP